MSEGKTKRQALKCVQRRLVNIVWAMLKNNEEYVNPPMYDLPAGNDGCETIEKITRFFNIGLTSSVSTW
jgi:hypothetical protein